MIKQLNISNYQSHKDSELLFDPGVNIIVGESDSGKTAIIRALRWVIWNKPTGNSMRSYWGGETSVELFTDDAHVVRSKDKEEEYVLGDSHFKAFRTEVPEEIQKALNMSTINLQKQLDQPFLISETSGNVAQHFNKVAKLDQIDTGLQNINSAINQLNSTLGKEAVKDKPATGLIKQIKDKQVELLSFAYLEKYEIEVEVLEELDKRYLSTLQRETKLEVLIDNVKEISSKADEYDSILEIEKPVNDILKLYDTKSVLFKQQGDLMSSMDNLTDIGAKINQQQILTELEKPVSDLLELHSKLYVAENDDEKLTEVLSILSGIHLAIEKKSSFIAVTEVQFKEGMGSTCILCGSKLK